MNQLRAIEGGLETSSTKAIEWLRGIASGALAMEAFAITFIDEGEQHSRLAFAEAGTLPPKADEAVEIQHIHPHEADVVAAHMVVKLANSRPALSVIS